MRIALRVEYDGSRYAGFQRQENAVAVQNVLERAAGILAKEPVGIVGASRTDAGVHSFGQVCHMDVPDQIPPERWAAAMNSLLPDDVQILESLQVAPDFHARFSACGKWYRYLYWLSPKGGPWWRQRAWIVRYPMDIERMREALHYVKGTHDFAAFQGSGAVVSTTVRTITRAELTAKGQLVILDIEGDGFLKNMVRILAGTLMQCGCGRRETDLEKLLRTRDRRRAGITAPAAGLTLMRVDHKPSPDWKTPKTGYEFLL